MEINTIKNKLFAQQDLTVNESVDLFELIIKIYENFIPRQHC